MRIITAAALAGSVAGIALAAVALWPAPRPQGELAVPLPETVIVPAGPYMFRDAGDYRVGTRRVDPPLETRIAEAPLEIMKYPVSVEQYAACVADAACLPAEDAAAAGPMAQTGVSHLDATAYARWLSRRTGQTWRLPSDAEWARAAAERFHDDAVDPADDGSDPSRRWLREYRQNIDAQAAADPDPQRRPAGAFGANAHGVMDMAGNVWEWTDSCMTNAQMDAPGGRVLGASEYCGVKVVEGRHRAFIIDFVRDARVGGCAAGQPPDHLGFRLVRAES